VVAVGLLLVVAVSVVVARIGFAYLDGAKAVRPPSVPRSSSTIDLTDRRPARRPLPGPRDWDLRGFGATEADDWIRHGFDADHAFLFRTLDVDAATAARLRRTGLADSALVTLVEEASATWRAAGWDIDAAAPWFAARFEPATAQAWRDAGFDADEAATWKREHFGVRQAVEWRRLGDTPARARVVEHRFRAAGITVAEGLRAIALGFSVDEICGPLDRDETPRAS
jgi:hypothetical protein